MRPDARIRRRVRSSLAEQPRPPSRLPSRPRPTAAPMRPGSALGMARNTSLSPPRPMPVSSSQWVSQCGRRLGHERALRPRIRRLAARPPSASVHPARTPCRAWRRCGSPQPDLQKRGALEKMRDRLVYTAFGFGLLFLAVIGKLADATILQPLAPHRPERPIQALFHRAEAATEATSLGQRATITDRNGQILAISLPTVAVFADPRQIIDPAEAAHRLKQVLPRLDEAAAQARLSDTQPAVRLSRASDHAAQQQRHQFSRHPRLPFPPGRAAPLPAGPHRRACARRRRCRRARRRRRREALRPAAVHRRLAAAAVARRARPGRGARRTRQGDRLLPGDRRLRHRDGRDTPARCWRWSACPTTTPTTSAPRPPTIASTAR